MFRSLLDLRPDEPIVIVLDEFQYLAAGPDGLREVASKLKRLVAQLEDLSYLSSELGVGEAFAADRDKARSADVARIAQKCMNRIL